MRRTYRVQEACRGKVLLNEVLRKGQDNPQAEAEALTIHARAEMRLAEEYDAAQERGEVGKSGARTDLVANGNEVVPPAADLGLRRDEIHRARSCSPGVPQNDKEKKPPCGGILLNLCIFRDFWLRR